jgi:hypothetical protein
MLAPWGATSRLFLGQRFDKIDAMTTDDLEPSSLIATASPLSESALDGLAARRVEPTRPVNDDAGTLMSLLRDEDHV